MGFSPRNIVAPAAHNGHSSAMLFTQPKHNVLQGRNAAPTDFQKERRCANHPEGSQQPQYLP